MKLRMRLILSYTALALAAAVILGGVSYYYIGQQYRSTVYGNARFTARQVLENYDMMQNMMEQTAEFILSSPDALGAIRELSTLMGKAQPNAIEINRAKSVVKRTVGTAYNMDNFYRVLVFNRHGFIASSAHTGDRLSNVSKDPQTLPWLNRAVGTKGKFVLLGLHQDDWSVRGKTPVVYSAVKEIQGDAVGFIEVQITADQLAGLLAVPAGKVIAVGPDDGLLYAADGLNSKNYEAYFTGGDGIFEKMNVESGRNELIVAATSDFSGVRILLVQDWDSLAEVMAKSEWITLAMSGTFLFFSICFIIVMANLLTKPIRQLRGKMENTQLSNMDVDIVIKSEDADIQALTGAYRDLLKRLRDAMTKEKRLTLLQLQAQFDALQAQINPHFLYNVLNIISNRGIQDDDETICEMCISLAAMLRYSASTVERYATLGQEIDYLKHYVYLLEARFENRLTVRIEVDEALYGETVPKITVQQLVENSIEHGYGNSSGNMEVVVRGFRKAGGWVVEVTDNGEGISEETREKLCGRMERVRTLLKDGKELMEMEIGGMGLINTYGRLYLLYQENTVFDIRKRADAPGTVAVIGLKAEG